MATAIASATDASQASSPVIMPETLSFQIQVGGMSKPGTITVKGKNTKSGVTYRGSKKGIKIPNLDGSYTASQETAADKAIITATLTESKATLNGQALNMGEVHPSAPFRYPMTKRDGTPHPQAGQVRANTGGQLTIRHSLVGDVHGQFSTVFLTITKVNELVEGVLVDKGYTVSAKVMPRVNNGAGADVEGFDLL